MELSFSLSVLFEQVWGYKTTAFEPEFAPVPSKTSLDPKIPIRKEQGAHGTPYYKPDANGREYFLPASITYAESQGTAPGGEDVEINKTIDLPYPVISISGSRRFVDTDLTERDGTATELINTRNYDIKVRGFFIAKNNELPEADIAMLEALWMQKKTVSFKNALTDIFLLTKARGGSDRVLIRDFQLPEVRGVKNVKAYELTITSDLPFNLIQIIDN